MKTSYKVVCIYILKLVKPNSIFQNFTVNLGNSYKKILLEVGVGGIIIFHKTVSQPSQNRGGGRGQNAEEYLIV